MLAREVAAILGLKTVWKETAFPIYLGFIMGSNGDVWFRWYNYGSSMEVAASLPALLWSYGCILSRERPVRSPFEGFFLLKTRFAEEQGAVHYCSYRGRG